MALDFLKAIIGKKQKNKNIEFKKDEKGKRFKIKKISIPKTAQQTIPFQELYENGLIKVTEELYCIVCNFQNINYLLAREDEQESKYKKYGELLNSLDPSIKFQLFLLNKSVDEDILIDNLIPKPKNDGLENVHNDYNRVQMDFINKSYDQTAEKFNYFVLGYETKSKTENIEAILNKAFRDVSTGFKKLESDCKRLEPLDVLELFYNFYNPVKAKEDKFRLPADIYKRGAKIKDYIAPTSFRFKNTYCEMGVAFNRTFFVRDYPEVITDTFVNDILDSPNNISVSMHIDSKDPSQSTSYLKNKILTLESQAQQRKKNNKREGMDYIPYDLKNSIVETNELLDGLTKRNQKMFLFSLYINVSTESLEELEDISKTINRVARKHLVTIDILSHRQEHGLASILPLAYNKIGIKRPLLTDSTAIFIPFSAQTMFNHGGFYYGLNSITNSMVVVNRKTLKNPNGFVLGIPGSGKSFKSKREIIDAIELTDDDVIIIDPEREFDRLCYLYKGENIKISPSSKNYLNPLDISVDYGGDDDPIQAKSDFILSIAETLKGSLTPADKTLIDRCVKLSYKKLLEHNWDKQYMPTLETFYNILKDQKEDQVKDLILAFEMYVEGSYNTFSKPSNVTLKNRLTVFDTKDLGKQLKKLGLLVTLDTVWNIISQNKEAGKNTWLFTDEFYLFFDDTDEATSYSSDYYFEVYKRARKYGGLVTGITQNVEDLLHSPKARTMLANSQFLILLDTAPTDRMELLKILNLSETQEAYITNAEVGCGLLICGKNVIPIEDEYPKDNILYKTITTKLDEVVAQ